MWPTGPRAYGFPGVVVDGNDVLACYEAMKTGASTGLAPARARP